MSTFFDRRDADRGHAPADRERASCDNRTGRALHNALGYQLRQVSKQIRELQKQAQALNIRSDETEACTNEARSHGHHRSP